jgi:hypothetical protein
MTAVVTVGNAMAIPPPAIKTGPTIVRYPLLSVTSAPISKRPVASSPRLRPSITSGLSAIRSASLSAMGERSSAISVAGSSRWPTPSGL